jgi:NAD(P)-dependent dehydrogenase (short-subunit alcohol dehydrogenase family)
MSPRARSGAPTEAAANQAPAKRASAKKAPAKRAPAKKAPATKATTREAARVAGAERLGSPGTGVLVTGAASGIGLQTALALAEVGRAVAIWDVDARGAEQAAVLCRERYGVAAHWSVVDVAETAALGSAVAEAEAALGSLGGFVHSAGVSGAAPVDSIDDEVWDATLDVNLRAGVMICRQLIEPFRRAGPGSSVVLVSSIEGLFGSVFLPAYCASKAGVLGVMRSLAHRFASEGFRVNAVCPGAVATPMLAPAFELPGFRQQVEERTPLQRVSTPDEIARPIRFLLSDEASFITGTHLTIDGGMTSVTAI